MSLFSFSCPFKRLLEVAEFPVQLRLCTTTITENCTLIPYTSDRFSCSLLINYTLKKIG